MAICPSCGNQTGEGAVFCDQCGTRLPQPEVAVPEAPPAASAGSVICPACGAGNVPGEAFCDYCGSPLEPPVPTAEVVPELEAVSGEAELEVETAEPEEPAAPSTPQEEAKLVCPACGADVLPGEIFCADCGASLTGAPIAPEPVAVVEEPPVEEAAPPAAVPAAIVEAAPAPPPTPVPAKPPVCPACGSEIEPGDAFCSSCGYALAAAPALAPVAETPAPPSPTTVGPRLVMATSGAEIPLPTGEEILVGREDPVSGVYPDVDLTPHGGEEGGVSRRHARLVREGGALFVEDLDSTNFTFVNKQRVAPKSRQALNDGDEIRFGRVTLVFKTS
jgi:predicted amidophosphoribosyltransferase